MTLTLPANALAGRIASQPPIAVRGARRAIDAAWYRSPGESVAVAIEEQFRCLRSHDFREGNAAAAEGRIPQWEGR